MTPSTLIRPPAVAGSFYPADPDVLDDAVRRYLSDAVSDDGPDPVAVVAPHAGYVYSGPVAGSAYARVEGRRAPVDRVLLLGPSHRVAFRGFAVPESEAFRTPLGDVRIDHEAAERALTRPLVVRSGQAHAQEHSLEVQLPFLQTILPGVPVLPIVVGLADAIEVAELLEGLWSDPATFVVVSSDLSHYLPYESAERVDRRTAAAVEALDWGALGDNSACGRIPLGGLMEVARRRVLEARTIDLRNSGDTAGPRDQVVGYGAFAFSPAQA